MPKIRPFLYGFLQVATPTMEKTIPITGNTNVSGNSGGIKKHKKYDTEAAKPMIQNTLYFGADVAALLLSTGVKHVPHTVSRSDSSLPQFLHHAIFTNPYEMIISQFLHMLCMFMVRN